MQLSRNNYTYLKELWQFYRAHRVLGICHNMACITYDMLLLHIMSFASNIMSHSFDEL